MKKHTPLELNKLEQQIYDAQSYELDWVDPKHMELIARIAAKIALELASKAYIVGWQYNNDFVLDEPDESERKTFEEFKQEIL
jgi:hypothetical protein